MTAALAHLQNARPVKLTARQFEQMTDPPAARLELVDGEIFVHSSPKPRHAWTLDQLNILLNQHVQDHDLGIVLGDVNTIFSEQNVRRPDLLYFRKARCHLVEAEHLRGLPDLAVEVTSPSSSEVDRRDKFEQYARGGIRHYWIVDPSMQSLQAYELRGGEYALIASGRDDESLRLPPFEDLAIALAKLWWAQD